VRQGNPVTRVRPPCGEPGDAVNRGALGPDASVGLADLHDTGGRPIISRYVGYALRRADAGDGALIRSDPIQSELSPASWEMENLGWDLSEVSTQVRAPVNVMRDIDVLVDSLVATVQPGDRLIVMSNGSFGDIHNKLLAALGERYA